jgi:hypothetical protein
MAGSEFPREHPDLRKGFGGSNDCLPAKQSAIFTFSAEDSKIVRRFAHSFDPRHRRSLDSAANS